MFFVEATEDKYIEAITLLRQSLFDVEFTEERAKTVISQLLNSIPSEKLSAAKIVGSLSDNIFFNNKSIIHHASFLRQQKYLIGALESLRVNPGMLIGKFHQIRNKILRPDNCFAFLTADLELLNRNYGNRSTRPWIEYFSESLGHRPGPEELSTHFRDHYCKTNFAITQLL